MASVEHANAIEAQRAEVEERLVASVEHANEMEALREATEQRLAGTLETLADLEMRLNQALEHANAIEAQRSATEQQLVAQLQAGEESARQVAGLAERVKELSSALATSVQVSSLPKFLRRRYS